MVLIFSNSFVLARVSISHWVYYCCYCAHSREVLLHVIRFVHFNMSGTWTERHRACCTKDVVTEGKIGIKSDRAIFHYRIFSRFLYFFHDNKPNFELDLPLGVQSRVILSVSHSISGLSQLIIVSQ